MNTFMSVCQVKYVLMYVCAVRLHVHVFARVCPCVCVCVCESACILLFHVRAHVSGSLFRYCVQHVQDVL